MGSQSFNTPQQKYIRAKERSIALLQQEREIDQRYIAERKIVNSDGSIPRASWAIKNKGIGDKAILECSKMIIDSGLWAEILKAREQLKEAEDQLIEFGLGIIPEQEKFILEKEVENYSVRKQIIDLSLRLDPDTKTGLHGEEKWHVVTTFYDKGKVAALIIDGREISDDEIPEPGVYEGYDLYVDTFHNLPEAIAFKIDALQAQA